MHLYNKKQLIEMKGKYGEDYEETIKYALSCVASMMQIGDMITGVDYGYRLKSNNFGKWESTDGRAIISSLLGIICDFAELNSATCERR